MKPILVAAVCVINCYAYSRNAWTDEPASAAVHEANQILDASVDAGGYKGGIPFYTAFHQGTTTRLLLLQNTGKLPEVAEYLQLSELQMQKIEGLSLPDIASLRSNHRDSMLDDNASVDEDIVDPSFYDFLSVEQQSKLDGLSMVFDGWSVLTRSSVANRLMLSGDTRQAIATVLTKHRQNLFLPYFRYVFAAKLPPDHDFRDCDFTGRYLATLNREIAILLSRDELKRFNDWAAVSRPPDELVEAIRRLAPLPVGLFGLHPWNDG